MLFIAWNKQFTAAFHISFNRRSSNLPSFIKKCNNSTRLLKNKLKKKIGTLNFRKELSFEQFEKKIWYEGITRVHIYNSTSLPTIFIYFRWSPHAVAKHLSVVTTFLVLIMISLKILEKITPGPQTIVTHNCSEKTYCLNIIATFGNSIKFFRTHKHIVFT